jgi:ribosome-associated toxin RatA of RatAB toxin-antitoxin module
MPKVTSKNIKLLNYPVPYVYRTLTDFASYPKWYPKPFKFDVLHLDSHAVGTTVAIENGRLVKWVAKITSFKPDELIGIDYIEGAWLGKTYWRFEDRGGKTRLTLEIDLEINKPWLRFLSGFMNFSKLHSRQMNRVFTALEQYLGSRSISNY